MTPNLFSMNSSEVRSRPQRARAAIRTYVDSSEDEDGALSEDEDRTFSCEEEESPEDEDTDTG